MRHAEACRCKPCAAKMFGRLMDSVEDPMAKLAFALAGFKTDNDAGGPILVEMPSMFHVSSEEDGYFVGVVMAHDADEAREIAWKEYTATVRPDNEWEAYHLEASELTVIDMGDSFFGADGEGNLEIDKPVPWDSVPPRDGG